MADESFVEKLESIMSEIASKTPGAKLTMSGGGDIFLHGYQDNTDCSYSLSVRVKRDQSLVFSERFDYQPREEEDDPGRVYVYGLVVESSQFEPFLRLLAEKCQREDLLKITPRQEALWKLLTQIVHDGLLALPQIKQRNVYQLAAWMQEAKIPHSEPYLAF